VLDTTVSEQLYGTGAETLAAGFRQYAPEADFTVVPVQVAGFTRTTAAD